MRNRDGFTMLELLVVLTIGSIVLTVANASVASVVTSSNMQGAATSLAADLQLAQTLAARQRQPVRISIDTLRRIVRVRDVATPNTVYSERNYGRRGDHPVSRMLVSDTSVVIYPNGLAAGGLSVRLFAATGNRRVTMTRAGLIRVLGT